MAAVQQQKWDVIYKYYIKPQEQNSKVSNTNIETPWIRKSWLEKC